MVLMMMVYKVVVVVVVVVEREHVPITTQPQPLSTIMWRCGAPLTVTEGRSPPADDVLLTLVKESAITCESG